jgi:hypothetical protein
MLSCSKGILLIYSSNYLKSKSGEALPDINKVYLVYEGAYRLLPKIVTKLRSYNSGNAALKAKTGE